MGCPLNDESCCAQSIKHMSVTEIKDHWKAFLQEISSLLLSAPKAELEDKGCPLAHPPCDMPPLPPETTSTNTCSSSGEVDDSCKSCCTGGGQAAAAGGRSTAAAAGMAAAVGKDGHGRPPGMRCPTNRKLDALVRKYLYLCKFVGLFNPGALYQLHAIDLENGNKEQVPDGDHWRKVVGYLELTSEQVRGQAGSSFCLRMSTYTVQGCDSSFGQAESSLITSSARCQYKEVTHLSTWRV
jgi:hypothetical protein